MAWGKIKIRGNAMIEFALVLPAFLLLTAGMVDLSVLYYDQAVITNASREGARYGVAVLTPSYPTTAQITTYVKNYTTNHLINFSTSPTNVTVTATPSTSPAVFGSTLNVTVNYTYTDLLLHHFINHGNQYSLSATTVMTYE